MSTKKVIGGSVAAIVILIIAQLAATACRKCIEPDKDSGWNM